MKISQINNFDDVKIVVYGHPIQCDAPFISNSFKICYNGKNIIADFNEKICLDFANVKKFALSDLISDIKEKTNRTGVWVLKKNENPFPYEDWGEETLQDEINDYKRLTPCMRERPNEPLYKFIKRKKWELYNLPKYREEYEVEKNFRCGEFLYKPEKLLQAILDFDI